MALLSPMVIYAGRDVPIPALFGVAAGIAIALMLTGRRLFKGCDSVGRLLEAAGRLSDAREPVTPEARSRRRISA